jgi:hypothetical protein
MRGLAASDNGRRAANATGSPYVERLSQITIEEGSMKKLAVACMTSALWIAATAADAQTPPEMPKPQKQHEWLTQLAGEWETEGELVVGPNQPVIQCKGKETVRTIGPFWILSENQNSIQEMQMTGVLTVGFDPKKDKFVGTWIDSVSNFIWSYEGTLDEDGKKLTLLTEGPHPTDPNARANYREVIEVKDKDHKVFTSSLQTDDGQWMTFVTINARRVK